MCNLFTRNEDKWRINDYIVFSYLSYRMYSSMGEKKEIMSPLWLFILIIILLASIYRKKATNDKALFYYNKALIINPNLSDKNRIVVSFNISLEKKLEQVLLGFKILFLFNFIKKTFYI